MLQPINDEFMVTLTPKICGRRDMSRETITRYVPSNLLTLDLDGMGVTVDLGDLGTHHIDLAHLGGACGMFDQIPTGDDRPVLSDIEPVTWPD